MRSRPLKGEATTSEQTVQDNLSDAVVMELAIVPLMLEEVTKDYRSLVFGEQAGVFHLKIGEG